MVGGWWVVVSGSGGRWCSSGVVVVGEWCSE